MSKVFIYNSVLAPYIHELLQVKESCGHHLLRYQYILKEIDNLYIEKGIDNPCITKSIIENWRETRINDKPSTLYTKYSVWALLARYISRHGITCFIPQLPEYSKSKNEFIPYIFTHNQIGQIFTKSNFLRQCNRNKKSGLMCLPAILRLLYSTGLRISEAVSIQNKSVDFDKKCILITKSKNGAERIVPINDSLCEVLLQYMSYRDKLPIKTVASPDQWLFISPDGSPCTDRSVTWWFRIILEECQIPYIGDHCGPRIHDLRHTFAVHSMMQMARAGIDLYTSLPIISTCLGHKSLSATEKYVRLTSEMFPDIISECSEMQSILFPKIPTT